MKIDFGAGIEAGQLFYLNMGEDKISGTIPKSIIAKEEFETGYLVKREELERLSALATHSEQVGFAILYQNAHRIMFLYWGCDEGLCQISGPGEIRKDVLFLDTWKDRGSADPFTSFDDIKKLLSSFPVWSKTKYYVKRMDIGPTQLRYCSTSKIAPFKIQKKIMPQLGFELGRF